MNRILIQLGIAIKNVDISKLSKNELDHFNLLKQKYEIAKCSLKAKDFNYQDEKNLLTQSGFKLETNLPYQTSKIIKEPTIGWLIALPEANQPLYHSPIPNLKDIPGSNPYTHSKIPHYKSILGFTIENGETFIYVTHWTSTNNVVQNVIEGTQLGDDLNPAHLQSLLKNQDQDLINYSKTIKNQIGKDWELYIKRNKSITRDNNTWAAGENGDKPLISVGKNIKGKNQFASMVVQKYPLKDIDKHFILANKIPPLNFKQFITNFYKNEIQIVVLDPITGTYSNINVAQFYFIDPAKLILEISDLQDINKLTDAIYLANNRGLSIVEIYKEKGLLIEIDPNTGEPIKSVLPFETLPIDSQHPQL